MSNVIGKCVKTGAQVTVLDYGRTGWADVFAVGDCIVIHFGHDVFDQGEFLPDGQKAPYEVWLGAHGFAHKGKRMIVVPRSQFRGELIE